MSKQFANDNNARFKHSMIVKSILSCFPQETRHTSFYHLDNSPLSSMDFSIIIRFNLILLLFANC